MATTMSPRIFLSACAALLLGCPAPEPKVSRLKTEPDPREDERVVEIGGNLYSAKDVERNLREHRPPTDEERKPGSGKPDESNGVCRLYAPKLPEPECCNVEYGFDAEEVRKACGFPVYLGESFYYSCGYYFHHPSGRPAWFRMTFVPGKTAEEAAKSHDRHLARLSSTGKPASPSTPVPGVPGAYWSFHDGLAWAFIPGWTKVRQLSWRDSFCDRDTVAKIIASIATAKQPAPGSPRLALVPKARR